MASTSAQASSLRIAQVNSLLSLLNLNTSNFNHASSSSSHRANYNSRPGSAAGQNDAGSNGVDPFIPSGPPCMEGPRDGQSFQRYLGYLASSSGPSRERRHIAYAASLDRPPLPDVPAVYFVSPTSQNVKRIAQDMKRMLYESFYVNFTSTVPKPVMEEFANLVAADGTGQLVQAGI